MALSDWFNLPVSERIERKDGRIRIEARDDVLVKKVHMKVWDEKGKVLEQGEAVQEDPSKRSGEWEYAANSAGKIEAEAWDLAGNRVRLTFEL